MAWDTCWTSDGVAILLSGFTSDTAIARIELDGKTTVLLQGGKGQFILQSGRVSRWALSGLRRAGMELKRLAARKFLTHV